MTSSARYALSGIGGLLLLSGLIVLTCIDQDDARHSFGHTGGMYHYRLIKGFHSITFELRSNDLDILG